MWFNLEEIREEIEPQCWDLKTFFKTEAESQAAELTRVLNQLTEEKEISRRTTKSIRWGNMGQLQLQ